MKKELIIFIFLSMMIFPINIFGLSPTAKAKISILVLDEQQNPMQEANVFLAFYVPRSRNPWDGLESENYQGITNKDGFFSQESNTVGEIGITVTKDGYYKSTTKFNFSNRIKNRWEPYNPSVKVILQKKILPIPMYARNLHSIEIPITDKPLGFDLIISDWVEPYGKGKVSDMIFLLTHDIRERYDLDATLKISMPQEGEGFAPISKEDVNEQSELKLPHEAVNEGYEKELILKYSLHPEKEKVESRSIETDNLFIKVRMETDENGNIIKALYGKIKGPIQFAVFQNKKPKLKFTYYVNPEPNSRNMEFDPNRNLLENLKEIEKVIFP